nr:peptidoglycan-binding protein [Clostridia bacterium]
MKSKALEKYVKYTKIPLVSAALMCVIMMIYAVVFGTASDLGSDDTAGEVLSVGDRGGEVWRIQEKLRELGYYRGESSGIYDRATSEAVRKFQLDEGLCADGSAGA